MPFMSPSLPSRSVGDWRSDIAERIGHFGLASWLRDMGEWLGRPAPFPPEPSERFHVVKDDEHGLVVKLHDPEWRRRATTPADAWVLIEAVFECPQRFGDFPFGLSRFDETPETAAKKLSRDVTTSDRFDKLARAPTATYFLPDHRAVVLTFNRGLTGLASIRLTRLYHWPDWRPR